MDYLLSWFVVTELYFCFQVEELVTKERELQEKLVLKHTTVVDGYEKKLGGREIENKVASYQQKITALRREVDDLMDLIDEIW